MPTADDSPATLSACHNHTLRSLRVSLGLSLRDVERETKIPRPILSLVERGMMIPEPTDLVTLSKLYGVQPWAWRIVVEHRIALLPPTSKEDDHVRHRGSTQLRRADGTPQG